MTVYEYKALDKEQQYNMLWNKGVFLAGRIYKKHNYLLYQIEGFYVELKYNSGFKILELRSFVNVNRLAPYLRLINLPPFD